MSEKGVLPAIIECKCPQCRKGKMFPYGAYNLKQFGKMHSNCSECQLRYEREPGFFYGAMYVSYALSVGIFLTTVFVLYFLLGDPEVEVYILTVGILAILLYPLNLRYSRVLFLYLFGGIKYEKSES